MRKLWFRRRGVSTMIGGIIVLSLFLVALVSMIVVSQQFDSYQSTVSTMQQKDIDRFSENLQPMPVPGISPVAQVDCPTSSVKCNEYQIFVANLGIGAQIARIYVISNTTVSPPPVGVTTCDTSHLSACILNPSSSPNPSSFDAATQYVNVGEFGHTVTLYLPTQISLTWANQLPGSQSVSIATTRGRLFTLVYPPPQTTSGAAPAGGTGLQIGPLKIVFQRALITYTTSNVYGTPYGSSNPALPLPNGATSGGQWVISTTSSIVVYLKIQTDWWAKSDVYLTPQSVFQVQRFDNPGGTGAAAFFAVAPPTPTLCAIFQTAPGGDSTVDCSSSPPGLAGTDGSPGGSAYVACGITPAQYYANPGGQPPGCGNNYRYRIPKPTAFQAENQLPGNPVYVAFGAKAVSKGGSSSSVSLNANDVAETTFLGLMYIYDDTGTGANAFMYGVTMPFIALCVNTSGTCSSGL